MTGSEESTVHEVLPWSTLARTATDAYFAEVNRRFELPVDIPAARASDDASLTPPRGRFFVTVCEDSAVACGGLFTVEPGVAEIKRLWVSPASRGKGLAIGMLRHLEAVALESGHTAVQLDANKALTEAQTLYKRLNYEAVPAFNTNPQAHFWFRKSLSPDRGNLENL